MSINLIQKRQESKQLDVSKLPFRDTKISYRKVVKIVLPNTKENKQRNLANTEVDLNDSYKESLKPKVQDTANLLHL